MKKTRKINMLGCILNILITVVVVITIIGLYYMAQVKILNKDYANIFGYTFFEVATGSMANTINIGDIVVVKVNETFKENDIIVYKEENSFITHRVIKIDGQDLITRGDANNSEDKPIKSDQILGKVIYVIPKIGIWRKVLASPEILGMIIIFIILLGVVLMLTSKTEKEK
mgnify:FL=1